MSARSPCRTSKGLRLDPVPPPQSVGLGTRGLPASVRFLPASGSLVLSTPSLLQTCLDPGPARTPAGTGQGWGPRLRRRRGFGASSRPPRPRLQGRPLQVHARGRGPDPLSPRTWVLRQILPRLGPAARPLGVSAGRTAARPALPLSPELPRPVLRLSALQATFPPDPHPAALPSEAH